MATKINKLQNLALPSGVMFTSWMEKQGLSRTEQGMYVKSGWLTRVATGVYRFSNDTPSLYGSLASYELQQEGIYRIGASAALELQGFTHYITFGKPQAHEIGRAHV